MSPEDRMREDFVLNWLATERTEKYWRLETHLQAILTPHLKNGGERLDELRERYWDQCFPWDLHQRLYESTLEEGEYDRLRKGRVLTGAAAIHALFQKMLKAGEI
jgi:hypothetical protein